MYEKLLTGMQIRSLDYSLIEATELAAHNYKFQNTVSKGTVAVIFFSVNVFFTY